MNRRTDGLIHDFFSVVSSLGAFLDISLHLPKLTSQESQSSNAMCNAKFGEQFYSLFKIENSETGMRRRLKEFEETGFIISSSDLVHLTTTTTKAFI